MLLHEAMKQPGVEVRPGFRVTRIVRQGRRVMGIAGRPTGTDPSREESFTAPMTIGADGLHSIFHRSGLVRVRRPRRQRYGLRAHIDKVEGLGSHVEVITDRMGEAYMAAHGSSTAMIALLLERRTMKKFGHDLISAYWETLQSIGSLRDRIQTSRLITPIIATGPLGCCVDRIVGDGFLLIGDSAGALDPITGEGMSLALKSANIAANIITDAFSASDFSAARLSAYGAARQAMFRPLARLTGLVLQLSRHETIAHWTINRLRSQPWVMQKLLAIASGSDSSGRMSVVSPPAFDVNDGRREKLYGRSC
jgi:flavin-dependent dehydrogenase